MDRERFRRLRNWQSEDWFPALVIRPITIGLLLVIADWTFLTPNRLTTLANLCKLVGTVLMVPSVGVWAGLGASTSVWLAVTFILLGCILDNADGTMARYRGTFSAFGSFYDKVSDIVTWFLICLAFGWRGYVQTHDVVPLVCAMASAYALSVRSYMRWLSVAESEKLRWHEAAADPSAAVARRTGPPKISTPPDRTPAQWARWFAISWIRILQFEEMDLFFWLCLGLVTDHVVWTTYLLVITQTVGMIGLLGYRAMEAVKLDRSMRPYRAAQATPRDPA